MTSWRTVDIVVASVLGVAFGVVFWQWGVVWAPLFAGQVNLGSTWGLDTVASGLMQGAGAELIFAVTLYRSFGLLTALLASAGAVAGEWFHDMTIYYPGLDFGLQLAYGAFMLVSGVLIAGLGSWLLARAMARTGVLAPFPSGQSQPRV